MDAKNFSEQLLCVYSRKAERFRPMRWATEYVIRQECQSTKCYKVRYLVVNYQCKQFLNTNLLKFRFNMLEFVVFQVKFAEFQLSRV